MQHPRCAPDRGVTRCRFLTAALLTAVLVTGVGFGSPSPAGAVQPGRHDGQLVSATSPVSWTPHVLDGYVSAIAEIGNTVVLGGNFTQFRAASNSTVINRSHLFSFQKGSGAINSGFAPIVNGEVTSVLSAGDGRSVFIAGGFSQLNGQTVRSLAKLDLATGQRITEFRPPAFNGRIGDMMLRNGKLYVTGRFTTVGGQPQTLVAAVDPVTGAIDPGVAATFADPRNGGTLSIIASDITPDGSTMVAIGNFTKVNDLGRYQIVLLDLTTTPISVADWSTTRYGDGCGTKWQSYMRDVDIAPDGSYFAVSTTGGYAAPDRILCDTLARWELGRTGSGQQPTWAEYTGGDTITAVAVTDTAVYAGGHYSYMNNPYISNSVAAGAAPREALSAHDARNGTVFSWNPGRTRAYGVYGFLATDQGLWIGSDTDRIAGYQYRGRIAFLPRSGGTVLPVDSVGTLPGQVVSLGLMQGSTGADLDRTRSRTFTGTSVTANTTSTSAGSFSWRNLRGAFMVSGRLYTGWSDRTFKVQSFDGSSFGPQTDVPLQLAPDISASLNRFASEDLATITGMFYDPARARIYFTKSGANQLFWRGFNTESQVVGAQRFQSAGGAAGVTWSGVQGMFMVDNQLFTVTTAGNLVRRAWDPAVGLPVAGTATTVSGPTIDGQDWRARDAFVYAPETAPVPNLAPVASFTSNCTEAACTFNGSASSDPDGSVTSYAWNFGDASSAGSGAVVSHQYAASGTYTVTLTVTDNRGATASSSRQLQVITTPTGTGTVLFRAAGSNNVNSTNPSVTVPAAVRAGDVMVAIATVNNLNTAVNGPPGWTLLRSMSDPVADIQSFVWTRTATATDPGSVVRMTNTVISKTALQLAAYSGASGVATVEGSFDTVSRAERTTPLVEVTTAGSSVVSYWADKSSATTTWSLPASVSLRDLSVGTSSGRIVAAIGDTGSLPIGTTGGFTATADSANRRAVMWSIVIAPT